MISVTYALSSEASLSRGDRKKSGGLRSGEYGGCSICATSFFCQELFEDIACVSIVVNKIKKTHEPCCAYGDRTLRRRFVKRVKISMYLAAFNVVPSVKPVDVNLSPKKASMTAGRKVEVRCYSSGSSPPARMSWFLGNEPLSNHTDLLSIDGNRTTSILSFWPSRSDHKKDLRCRAENFLLSGSALEDGWNLNITYVPQVSLTIRSSTKHAHSSLLEGDDVRFECDVRANPPANEVGWLFEGRPLGSDDPELVMSYRSLLIRRVKKKHRGRYQCYANNAEGTGMSRVVTLRAMCE
ncbi:uncharacterized protein NPIL_139811 [Nephila pilipes]|uniref:Ig-like domain-containing protein n=1 Tax=Nephila pilipes TaxID=299642 RepID=A0A8X6TLB4_NEPPI|nr:uncharacterized protein NPIL_139811 [Nephila pilipes]